jgi:caffeoyl-CoA O-methyltransferase
LVLPDLALQEDHDGVIVKEDGNLRRLLLGVGTVALLAPDGSGTPTVQDRFAELDKTVQAFLERHRGTWRDLNVPESDGRILHDLILEHKYTRALEIGTSTGHSAVWIAWALAKTGGRLTTVEIDSRRHQTALANFKSAGLASYIDARLGDAHEIVPALAGPFDFVFSDADKEWYKNYLVAVWPKIAPGGCFTAHNVSGRMSGIAEFLSHLKTLPDAETTFAPSSREGISITYKRPRKELDAANPRTSSSSENTSPPNRPRKQHRTAATDNTATNNTDNTDNNVMRSV